MNRLGSFKIENVIEDNLFFSEYQPIVSANLNNIFAYEAFIRTTSNVKPNELFESARDKGILYEVDIAAILNAIKEFPKTLFKDYFLFVNIFPSTLTNPKFCDFIELVIAYYPEIKNRIILEINESSLEKNYWFDENLAASILHLELLGFKIAIDDIVLSKFWLEIIAVFNPHFVKIDKSYSQNLSEKSEEITFLLTVIDKRVNLVLEGIEKEEDFVLAKQLGVPLMQGYYFSKPLRL
ncbi:EAL domain-containing protein [Fredinandcohnia humi]